MSMTPATELQTPTWAIFSGGLVTLMLAGFVAVVDWRGWKRWAFPFIFPKAMAATPDKGAQE